MTNTAKPPAFEPYTLVELPADTWPAAGHDEFQKIDQVKRAFKWLLRTNPTAWSVSYGKDSSCTLGLGLAAAAELAAEGQAIQPFVVLHSATGVDNPAVEALARSETAKVEAWIAKHQLPGTIHIARPRLGATFPVAVISGRSLPSIRGAKRDCASDLKVQPLTRLRRQVVGSNDVAQGKFVVSVTGVRAGESAARAQNLAIRRESDTALVVTNAEGNVAFAPLFSWSADDVFTYLGLVANGLLTTYSTFEDVIALYRDATGECFVGLGDDAQRGGEHCSPRTGCWCCLQSASDKSMQQMIREPQHAHMAPLARFRDFLDATYYDLERRTWVGRTIDEHGYIRFGPDGYAPSMLLDLLKYALTIDIEEREAAARLGIEPRFQIISLEQLFAICCAWSLHAFAPPFAGLRIYRDILRGARYPVPDVPISPKVPIPPARYIFVGDWDDGEAGAYTGLRDPLLEAFGGAGCMGTRQVRSLGEMRTVMDIEVADSLQIDPEGAELFIQFEMDRYVDEWHSPSARRPLSIGGQSIAGVEYRTYLAYGFIAVAKGRVGEIDRLMRRSAYRERMGLAGHNYDHVQALAMSVEAPVPRPVDPAALRARHREAVQATRDWKRRQLRQQRLDVLTLYREWCPSIPWRKLVRTGQLIMPALPRAREGRLIRRHLVSPYDLIAFLRAHPLFLQQVCCFRRRDQQLALFPLAA